MMNTYFDAALWQIISNQNRMLGMLTNIQSALTKVKTQENAMALDLSKLTNDVAAQTTVVASNNALLVQLKALVDGITTTDPQTQAQLDALSEALEANTTSISNAIVANTPAAGQ